MEIPTVRLHPGTHRAIGKGHPWVTPDGFSRRFPKEAHFLKAALSQNRFAILLNDSRHPQVKARLWDIAGHFSIEGFRAELRERLNGALLKRARSACIHERENYYLAFGEGDRLPGLFLLRLKNILLVQYYCLFWEMYEKWLLGILGECIPSHFGRWKTGACLIQKRNPQRNAAYGKAALSCFSAAAPSEAFTLREFGIDYRIFLKDTYDVGLYTDMSAFRKRLAPLFETAPSALNLFSHTGAFSLFGLKHGCRVTSVDLSGKYLSILEENLRINENLPAKRHRSLCMGVEKALDLLKKRGERFGLILCDPPSFSSDGDKSASAISRYPMWLGQMGPLCEGGGHLILFLNTHQVSVKKFKEVITRNLPEDFRIVREMGLAEDCPVLPGFSEGEYLKCLVLQKSRSRTADGSRRPRPTGAISSAP